MSINSNEGNDFCNRYNEVLKSDKKKMIAVAAACTIVMGTARFSARSVHRCTRLVRAWCLTKELARLIISTEITKQEDVYAY